MFRNRFLVTGCLVAFLTLSICRGAVPSARAKSLLACAEPSLTTVEPLPPRAPEEGDSEPCDEWASSVIQRLESYIKGNCGREVDLSETDLMTQMSTLYDECYDRDPDGGGGTHMALGYLTGWRGPVPDTGDTAAKPGGTPACYVQGVEFLPKAKAAAGAHDAGQGTENPLVAEYAFTRVDIFPRYDNIHQHDVLGYNYPLTVQCKSSSVWFANAFHARSTYGEYLKAVGFYTLAEEVQYEVLVVTNFAGLPSLTKGKSVAKGTIDAPGYHTIDLAEPIKLAKGSRFAVIVRQTAGNRPQIATDSAKGDSVKRSLSRPGESYVRWSGVWRDLNDIEPNANVCLKAFTVDEPPPASAMMDPADMHVELEYVLNRMRAENPSVPRSGFTAQQLSVIDDVLARIAHPLTKQDYYFQLLRIFAMVGESQTTVWAPFSESLFLHLPFVWLMDDGIVVSKDASPLLKGDVVLSIGGASPDELTGMLRQIVFTENEFWVREEAPSLLERGSYLQFLGLVNPDRTVNVEVFRDGKATVYRIPLGSTWNSVSERPVTTWRIEKDFNLGYLRFDDFPQKDEMESLLQEIDAFFQAVKEEGVSNIVVDWRWASGGYAHILHEFLGYFEVGPIYYEGNRRYYTAQRSDSETFGGNTYVLTSNKVFGAAAIGVMLLHDNGLAKTVGEPIGAKPNFNWTNRPMEKLPITGWTFKICNMVSGRPRNLDPTVTTLHPDIPVFTSLEDLLLGRDPQLHRVREICAGKPVVLQ